MILHPKIVILRDMMKSIHILITAVSSLIGIAYFAYISNVKFPSDAVRVVPLVWLIGAVTGLIFGFRSLRNGGNRYIGILVIILAILNTLFASIFSLAALMGD